ncbi:MAG: RHS repeat protein, partial [Akkermansiaceae bacterium]|nr:RHS repeat protein [Akkermansiaceae bacterium]
MTTNNKQSVGAPASEGVQEQNSCPEIPPMGSTPVAYSCDHTPVIDGDTESTTPSAAAIASANLNSGTDCATTNTNTVMNTTSNTTSTVQTDDASAVTIANQNSNAVDYSTFPDIHPEAWVEIFNDVLVDETPGAHGHRGFNASEFSIEEGGAYLEVCLTADDEGILKIENADNSEEVLNITAQLPEGEWTHLDDADYWQRVEYKYLPEGNYRIIHHLYNNPDYGTTNNRALYRFKIKKLSASDHYIPIVGESVRICCNCLGCVDKEGNELHIAVEKLPITMKYECMSAAEFVLKGGSITDNARSATAPCGYLKSLSPFAWTASVDSSNGDIYLTTPKEQVLRFCREANTNALHPVGSTAIAGFQLEQANEDTLILHDDGGQKLTFSISSGKVTAYTDANGCITTAEDIANQAIVEHDVDGNIKSVYSAISGYTSIVTEADGSVLVSWFAPEQVTVLADSTMVTSGEPYKTARYAVQETETGRIVTMTRQQKGMSPHIITRTEEPGRITITNGLGNEAIVRVYEQNINTDGQFVKTEILKKGENIASSTASVYSYSPAGWLLVKKTEAYGTPLAQNTYYHYNAQHLIQRMINDAGAYTAYEYDSLGRITMQKSPWGASLAKVTRTTYATARFFDIRPASVADYHVNASGTEVLFRNTAYSYEETAELERVTTTVTAGGSSLQQISIEETFGTSPAYAYAAGKPKFSQDITGVQTVHEYAATTEHDAIHKHTSITKVNGELVAGQSRKSESFIAANDTTTFEQESIWDGTQWLLLNTTAYEYDEQQRVVKTTRGNGRFSTTTWMCCGRLSETDEDGITTTYAYDSARQLTEISREEVYNGETSITPETITEFTRDAAGRVLTTTRRVGAMETTEATEYDALGRVTRQTDVLGRVTTTAYSADGLTTTVTSPAGATTITTRNTDGSAASISGTAQRALVYVYDLNGNSLRTTTKLEDGTTIAQSISNGFGQTTVQAQASTTGFIYTRSEFNAKGQLVKQYQDTGWNTAKTAATLYEYDSFGNICKQTLALTDAPTKDNSPVVEIAHSVESAEDGIYSVTTQTRYNAAGEPLSAVQKQLISQLSTTLASKSISTDERGSSSVSWVEYTAPAKMTSFSTIPTSEVTAESVSIDGFTISHKNHAGIITTASRSYTDTGMTIVNVDGRNNATSIHSDLAGRTIRVTDAANATTTTAYDAVHDQPAVVTDAMGNTSCYKYDARGRKIAEWGTALQPACFGYDDMDNMITLCTFRADNEVITTDPSERTDGDVTTWAFNPVTGLEISKTYADNTTVVKTYDAYN